jgi:hypothetical protein
MWVRGTGRMILTEKIRSTRRKSCLTATPSTTDPIWNGPESNGGLRDARPTTNRLSHSTARGVIYVAALRNNHSRRTDWPRATVTWAGGIVSCWTDHHRHLHPERRNNIPRTRRALLLDLSLPVSVTLTKSIIWVLLFLGIPRNGNLRDVTWYVPFLKPF